MFCCNQRRMFNLIFFCFVALTLAGCGAEIDAPTASISSDGSDQSEAKITSKGYVEPVQLSASEPATDSPAQVGLDLFPEVLVQTSMGEFRLRLNGEKSPKTVENFLENYVNRGFYSQTIFHYVDTKHMIAGGGFSVTRESKPTLTSIRNEAHNGLSNRRGTIAMARDAEFSDSAKSQFFINLSDNSHLDHQENEDGLVTGYCVFGEVVEGIEIVEQIAAVPVVDDGDFQSTPAVPVIIESIRNVER